MSVDLWLVATDLSDCSLAACKEAARLAAATESRLLLLHVHLQEIVREEFATGEVTAREQAKLTAKLEELKSALNDVYPNLPIDVDVLSSTPVSGIIDEADRLGVSNIVLGTHGRKGLAHMVLGSVAEEVVRRAKVPVMVVKSVK
ncbi:MAG: universal stress protein [Deltaproteobacteria bacterium]|nr:universal stress protein [Deltaproteobacteria bacterium]